MEAMEWITMFLITGLCTSPSFCAQHQPHCLVETPKTWSEAQSYCRERGHDLATIVDMAAMEALLPLVVNHDNVWTGINAGHPKRWFWSLADHHFDNEGERNYRNFQFYSGSDFFVTSMEGSWLSTADFSKLCSFICYDTNKQGRDRYVLLLQAVKATQALEYCIKHHTDMVSIRNQTENQVVREVAAGNEVWIGLFSDGWRWSDGDSTTFRFWHPLRASFYGVTNKCGTVGKLVTWGIQECVQKFPFLCTCNKVRVLKATFRSEDLQDLNDPATKAAILQQMQQLVEKATEGLKITWRLQPNKQVFTREQCHQDD